MTETTDTDSAALIEDDLAQYLRRTPEFFERHAELLAEVRLHSPLSGRVVNLQERQAELLREKLRLQEQRMMDFIRLGGENMFIADKLLRWSRQLFLVGRAVDLPAAITDGLERIFSVPQVALKLWDVADVYEDEPFAQGASESVRSLADSLLHPYCGVNAAFDAAQWLAEPAQAASLALLALRGEGDAHAFGLLVLASPDSQRFQAGMGTDFLERIAGIASAALSRVRGDQ
ncbi:MAG: DUF484 family protein [Ottowia sp.]|nr:DUF484 family protein [Ottowia sp.]